jgi:polysaccharide deacetylase 2 family uncharacterized protein YibQ
LKPVGSKGAVGGPWLVFLAVVLLAGLIGFLVGHYLNAPPKTAGPSPSPTAVPLAPKGDPSQAANELLKTLNQKLADMDLLKLLDREVETKPATVEGKVVPTYYEVFRLPSRMTPHDIGEVLREAAKPLGAKMTYDQSLFEFQFTPDWNPVEMDFVPTAKPRVCLIIDDGGYQRGEALKALYGLKVPVTVSLIPHTTFSNGLAQEFPAHGVEVMCHMPMEGHEKGMVGGDYKELLKKGMGSTKAREEVKTALANLPNCRGLNNHMGSVATTDPELMWDVCEVLKDQGLFIIDSKTTAQSVVAQVAGKAGVAVARRNVFLDNVETPEAIQKQLNQAVAYARKHGLAVAIGHFKTTTLKTLEEAVRTLKDQGIQFVYASEVVK